MEWHHKAPYRKKNKAKMPEKLALSDGEVIILGGSKKPRIEWGARAGGLRVSRCFNPQPDLDNANVGSDICVQRDAFCISFLYEAMS